MPSFSESSSLDNSVSRCFVPLSDIHFKLFDEGLIEGIEIVNDTTYSDHALQVALDYNLTMIGTSDIHGIVDWQYKIPSVDTGLLPWFLLPKRHNLVLKMH